MPTTTSLALSLLLNLTQQEAARPEPSAPAAQQAPAPAEAAPTAAPENALAAEAPPEKRELSRITLKDGQELRGVVVHRDARIVVVELATGGRLELPATQVERVEAEPHAQVRANGEVWFQDPNRTRYLYAPSGMMLRQGEGYFSQKELFFSSMNYGLTDHITVQVGAVVPAWLASGGFNLIGGVKVGGSVTDRLHLAIGAQALFLPSLLGGEGGAAGFLFGTATYGTPDAHVSLALGKPFTFASGEEVLNRHYIVALSGNVRMTQTLALVTENWLMPTLSLSDNQLPMINSLALRIFGEHWSVDLGGIRIPEVPIPIPWLDFTYNFG
jgi:hypothetical protein